MFNNLHCNYLLFYVHKTINSTIISYYNKQFKLYKISCMLADYINQTAIITVPSKDRRDPPT